MRQHFSRPAFLEGLRDMLPAVVGMFPFGIVCGVAAISAGASPLAALAMSLIMFSGAAQIIAVGNEIQVFRVEGQNWRAGMRAIVSLGPSRIRSRPRRSR